MITKKSFIIYEFSFGAIAMIFFFAGFINVTIEMISNICFGIPLSQNFWFSLLAFTILFFCYETTLQYERKRENTNE